jgi:hypothetical protein
LYVPYVINNVLCKAWSFFRHPYRDPSTGNLVVLAKLGWAPLWAAQLSSVIVDYQYVARFRDEVLPYQLNVGPAFKQSSAGPKRSASTPATSSDDEKRGDKKRKSTIQSSTTSAVCVQNLLYDTQLTTLPCKFGDGCTYEHHPSTMPRASILAHISSSNAQPFQRDSALRARLVKAVKEGAIGTA